MQFILKEDYYLQHKQICTVTEVLWLDEWVQLPSGEDLGAGWGVAVAEAPDAGHYDPEDFRLLYTPDAEVTREVIEAIPAKPRVRT